MVADCSGSLGSYYMEATAAEILLNIYIPNQD
jgi:hypothetical protein